MALVSRLLLDYLMHSVFCTTCILNDVLSCVFTYDMNLSMLDGKGYTRSDQAYAHAQLLAPFSSHYLNDPPENVHMLSGLV